MPGITAKSLQYFRDTRRSEVGGGTASHEGSCMPGISSVNAGIKFKPDTFDETVPLREFLTQFNLIARINAWPDAEKAVVLTSNLRGKARVVLDGIRKFEV